jgi:hypothetical protein
MQPVQDPDAVAKPGMPVSMQPAENVAPDSKAIANPSGSPSNSKQS